MADVFKRVRFRLALLDALAKGRFLAEDRVMKIKVIASAFLAVGAIQTPISSQPRPEPTLQPPLSLSRLDCGSIDIANLADFSDTGRYEGQKKTLVASCYLVRSGDKYLLWDTGLDGALAGKPRDKDGSLVREKIATQLARGKVRPEDITYVGISHYHYDHTGQVADFPDATLLVGKGDWEALKTRPSAAARFAHWLKGGGKVEPLQADRDVFGDGRVRILKMPGHTEGHQALLVRLAGGPVLISGDQYHFAENRQVGGVPSFNVNRAETLASHDRFEKLAANLKARVIIQHEPADVAKLPPFPQAAR
jgi:glyoxylase-like metal-dependent hydrolase (beta-lactamase superfamily II)